jgi:hypothetical protein
MLKVLQDGISIILIVLAVTSRQLTSIDLQSNLVPVLSRLKYLVMRQYHVAPIGSCETMAMLVSIYFQNCDVFILAQ